MPPEVREAILSRQRDLIGRRRHFHAEPELSFREVETARVIADHLRDWGLAVQTGVASTGVVGPSNVAPFEPLMVGEDFAYFLQERPGCFFLLGGAPETGPRVHHTADFAIDEGCLPVGLEVMAASVLRMLEN